MIEKTVKIFSLNCPDQIQSDLKYWLSWPLEERISEVETMRRQYHGKTTRLQGSVRVAGLVQ